MFCIFHFRTQHTERVGCLRVVFVLFLKRIESCYIVLETVFLKNVFFKYDISKYVLQKYIFYGYEASVMAFISLILRKTSEKLCLPLCHKSLQEKGQEIRESIEFSIESYILITQFYAVFYIGILVFFQQIV